MVETIVVCGYGVGISNAVARRFAKEGYRVAAVARNVERLTGAVDKLAKDGIDAKAFPCDLSDSDAVRKLVADVHASFGPIKVVHWNAFSGAAGDLKTASTADLRAVLDVTVNGLIAATQAALPDLKAQGGAVLVTGGGFAFYDPTVDAAATQWGAAGLAIGKAAQHKTVGLLSKTLQGDGVYVGEVVVTGLVKGTAFDTGNATLEASTIAEKFWQLFHERDAMSATI
jgi:NADP-dependent 3-hydroxy acid dehydrogenase YdfG